MQWLHFYSLVTNKHDDLPFYQSSWEQSQAHRVSLQASCSTSSMSTAAQNTVNHQSANGLLKGLICSCLSRMILVDCWLGWRRAVNLSRDHASLRGSFYIPLRFWGVCSCLRFNSRSSQSKQKDCSITFPHPLHKGISVTYTTIRTYYPQQVLFPCFEPYSRKYSETKAGQVKAHLIGPI